jgi:L-ascorbate metabolism protein UlaG (beta-lactamase superfamily)
MTTSFANTLTLSSIEAGAAKILIDPFLSDNPSWDKGWIGSRPGEDSTQGGVR